MMKQNSVFLTFCLRRKNHNFEMIQDLQQGFLMDKKSLIKSAFTDTPLKNNMEL